MLELDICRIPFTLTPREDRLGVMVKYMEVGPKRSTTRTFSMLDKVVMVLVELDIGLVLDLLPPIIQVIIVNHLVFIVTVITEVDIGITLANFLHITMVD